MVDRVHGSHSTPPVAGAAAAPQYNFLDLDETPGLASSPDISHHPSHQILVRAQRSAEAQTARAGVLRDLASTVVGRQAPEHRRSRDGSRKATPVRVVGTAADGTSRSAARAGTTSGSGRNNVNDASSRTGQERNIYSVLGAGGAGADGKGGSSKEGPHSQNDIVGGAPRDDQKKLFAYHKTTARPTSALGHDQPPQEQEFQRGADQHLVPDVEKAKRRFVASGVEEVPVCSNGGAPTASMNSRESDRTQQAGIPNRPDPHRIYLRGQKLPDHAVQYDSYSRRDNNKDPFITPVPDESPEIRVIRSELAHGEDRNRSRGPFVEENVGGPHQHPGGRPQLRGGGVHLSRNNATRNATVALVRGNSSHLHKPSWRPTTGTNVEDHPKWAAKKFHPPLRDRISLTTSRSGPVGTARRGGGQELLLAQSHNHLRPRSMTPRGDTARSVRSTNSFGRGGDRTRTDLPEAEAARMLTTEQHVARMRAASADPRVSAGPEGGFLFYRHYQGGPPVVVEQDLMDHHMEQHPTNRRSRSPGGAEPPAQKTPSRMYRMKTITLSGDVLSQMSPDVVGLPMSSSDKGADQRDHLCGSDKHVRGNAERVGRERVVSWTGNALVVGTRNSWSRGQGGLLVWGGGSLRCTQTCRRNILVF